MKTIKIRAAVAVDTVMGFYAVVGSDLLGKPDGDPEKHARSELGRLYNVQVTIITAEIPIREIPEVEAEVEG